MIFAKSAKIADFETIFADFETKTWADRLFCRVCRVAHPGSHSLSHALLEGGAKGAIAPESALVGQLLGSERSLGGDGLVV